MDVDVEGEGQSAGLKGLLEEDDQALSLSAFETLEKEFQDVLATLAGDKSALSVWTRETPTPRRHRKPHRPRPVPERVREDP